MNFIENSSSTADLCLVFQIDSMMKFLLFSDHRCYLAFLRFMVVTKSKIVFIIEAIIMRSELFIRDLYPKVTL